MISDLVHYGGARYQTTGSTINLVSNDARVQVILPTAAIQCRMPDARTMKTGGPCFYLINVAGAQSMTFRTTNGTLMSVLLANQYAHIALVDNSTAEGVWQWRTATKLAEEP